MPPKGRGPTAPGPAAKAQAVAKSKARALAKRTSQHNARMMVRRAAVRELNVLAQHVGAAPLSPKQASKQQVQRLLKLLQRRLVDQGQLVLLHAAAARWVSHGGDVGGVLVPPPSQLTRQLRASKKRTTAPRSDQ